jgi:MFS family permease
MWRLRRLFSHARTRRQAAAGSPSPNHRQSQIIWFTGLGIGTYAAGALALRIVEARIDGVGVARRSYAAACFVGALGLIVLAGAPNYLAGSAGVLLVGGIALTVTRSVGEIWINRRTTSEVRATMQSFLAQVEYTGEILCGIALGALAQFTSWPVTFACSAALIALAGVLVLKSRTDN